MVLLILMGLIFAGTGIGFILGEIAKKASPLLRVYETVFDGLMVVIVWGIICPLNALQTKLSTFLTELWEALSWKKMDRNP